MWNYRLKINTKILINQNMRVHFVLKYKIQRKFRRRQTTQYIITIAIFNKYEWKLDVEMNQDEYYIVLWILYYFIAFLCFESLKSPLEMQHASFVSWKSREKLGKMNFGHFLLSLFFYKPPNCQVISYTFS